MHILIIVFAACTKLFAYLRAPVERCMHRSHYLIHARARAIESPTH